MEQRTAYAVGFTIFAGAAAGLGYYLWKQRGPGECSTGFYFDAVNGVCCPIGSFYDAARGVCAFPDPEPCTSDSDCPEGQICESGECVVVPEEPEPGDDDDDDDDGDDEQPSNPQIYGVLADTTGNPISGTVHMDTLPLFDAKSSRYTWYDAFVIYGGQGDMARGLISAGDKIQAYGALAGEYEVADTTWATDSNALIVYVKEELPVLDVATIIRKRKTPTYTTTPFGEGYYEKTVVPGSYFVWAEAQGYAGTGIAGVIRGSILADGDHRSVVVTDSPVEENLIGRELYWTEVEVIDGSTGSPLPDVHVESAESSDFIVDGYTGADGKLRITDMDPGMGEVFVYLSKDGYQKITVGLTFNQTKTATLTTEPKETVYVWLYENDGALGSGVIEIYDSSGTNLIVSNQTVDGMATFWYQNGLSPGTYIARCDAGNGKVGETTINIVAGASNGADGNLYIVLSEGDPAPITITVLDQDGNPVENAAIEFFTMPYGGGTTTLVESGTTDANGQYVSAANIYDVHGCEVTAFGDWITLYKESVAAWWDLPPPYLAQDNNIFTFTRPTPEYISIYGSGHTAPSDVSWGSTTLGIEYTSLLTDDVEVTTLPQTSNYDENGNYEYYGGLPNQNTALGLYLAHLINEGKISQAQRDAAISQIPDLPTSYFETTAIEGYVTDQEGNAISGVTVAGPNGSTTTDTDGWYRLTNMPYGNSNVTADMPGYTSQTISGSIYAIGARHKGHNFTLPLDLSQYSVIVTVYDFGTKSYTSGVTVKVSGSSPQQTCTTDQNGVCTVTGVAPDFSGYVQVSAKGITQYPQYQLMPDLTYKAETTVTWNSDPDGPDPI